MQVIEWNGIPLTGISHDEVSRIIANQIGDEIEVVIRTDINLLQDQYGHYNNSSNSKMNGKEFSNLYIHIENIIECHTRISWPLTITFTFKS